MPEIAIRDAEFQQGLAAGLDPLEALWRATVTVYTNEEVLELIRDAQLSPDGAFVQSIAPRSLQQLPRS